MSENWSETRARECLNWMGENRVTIYHTPMFDPTSSLAALLREVEEEVASKWSARDLKAQRADTLAEVRRVVEDQRMRWHRVSTDHAATRPAILACDEILASLEKLSVTPSKSKDSL